MQIRVDNPLSSHQNNISSSDRGGDIFLQKGEIVQAVVGKSIGEGQFILNMKGMTIEASTELALTPGQNLVLISAGLENGRIILKIPSPEELYSARVSNHLQDIGLRVDERSVLMADKLIQFGLPVTKANLDNVEGRIRLLGGYSSQNLDTAVLSLLGGIRNDKQILSALQGFLTSPTLPKGAIEQAIQFLQTISVPRDLSMMQEKYNPAPANEFVVGSALTVNDGEQLLAGRSNNTATTIQTEQPVPADNIKIPVNVPTSLDSSGMPVNVPTPLDNSGMPPSVASPLDNSQMPTSVPPLLDSPIPTGELSPLDNSRMPPTGVPLSFESSPMPTGGTFALEGGRLQEVLNLLQSVADFLVIRGEESPEVIVRDLQTMFNGQAEVLRALSLIQAILVSNYPHKINEIENVLKFLQAARGEMIGQTAFNSANNLNTLQMGAYYFAFPLEINGQDHLVELKLYKEDREKRSLNEQDEIRLAISLNTNSMGIVVLHLHWRKDQGIVIQGAVSHQDYKE
ncbi:MAG: hypothetical protein GX825_03605, partial [Syntrophomonadaceae bacterium]|nr:hypothetical protein [Syntrophomonadaceae bacterium]